MKTLFVKDLKKAGFQIVEVDFGVKETVNALSRDQKPYKSLVLIDKTGEIPGKIWQDFFSSSEDINIGEVATISGQVEEYKGKTQVKITKLTKSKEYDLNDFVPAGRFDLDKMFEKLEKTIDQIKNRHLKKLLKTTFEKPRFAEKFKKAPGAKVVHHAYLGGLMEHTMELVDFAKSIFPHYPDVDQDLVISAILLHDIGKVEENKVGALGLIERTQSGEFLGHVAISTMMVDGQIPTDFPADLKMHLLHIILSHHGLLEYGSPVIPKTMEAMLVHHVDVTSSDLAQVKRVVEKEGDGQKAFSGFDQILKRSIYLLPKVNENDTEPEI